MSYRAAVVRATGFARHVVAGAAAPVPAWVEIEHADGLWYLHRLTAAGDEITDTCHFSREEAERQAYLEYGVGADAWREVEG
jgi:hypothetical protein